MFFLFYNSNLLWSFSLLGDCVPSFHFIYNPFFLFKTYLLAKGTLFFRTIFYISRGNCSVWLFGDNFLSSDSIIILLVVSYRVRVLLKLVKAIIILFLLWHILHQKSDSHFNQCIRTVKFVVPYLQLSGAVTE